MSVFLGQELLDRFHYRKLGFHVTIKRRIVDPSVEAVHAPSLPFTGVSSWVRKETNPGKQAQVSLQCQTVRLNDTFRMKVSSSLPSDGVAADSGACGDDCDGGAEVDDGVAVIIYLNCCSGTDQCR
jgi:hypothetical protein